MTTIKWTPERINLLLSLKSQGKKMKDIASEMGETEGACFKAIYKATHIPKTEPEDIFSYGDVELITGISVKEIQNLILESKLRGNGTVERKDLINFVLHYPGSCEKGNVVQIIYLLGGEKCGSNLY